MSSDHEEKVRIARQAIARDLICMATDAMLDKGNVEDEYPGIPHEEWVEITKMVWADLEALIVRPASEVVEAANEFLAQQTHEEKP